VSDVLVRAGRWVTNHLVLFVGLLVLLYMFLPVMVVVLMSFDDTADVAYQFNGFTLANWSDPCSAYNLCEAVSTSLQIGLLATVGATLLGTLMAFAMARHHFRGRSVANVGMFCLSFVVVAVKARLSGMDNRLEQAAMDLYANEWQTFWRVTFPLVFPGIVGAALLAFSLSFDDYIITNLVSGQTETFPMFVWGVSRREIPPQINVIGTAMLLLSLVIVVVAELARRRRNRA
jgi:spermidine/putrescine transport system permease protein